MGLTRELVDIPDTQEGSRVHDQCMILIHMVRNKDGASLCQANVASIYNVQETV